MATKQIPVGELKVGDEFTDINASDRFRGDYMVVTYVGYGVVEAYPVWDKNAENMAVYNANELVEITIA